MKNKKKKQNNKKGKGQNNSESDNQNVEGKCSHVQECVKFTNLNNTIPHADLSKCQDCLKLIEKPTEASRDKKSDSVVDGNDGPDSTQGEEKSGICICLRCGNIACSRQSSHQHAVQHYNSKTSHPLVINLSNWVIWCYKCDNEVDVEINPALGQCLTLLKKALGVKNAKQEKRIETSQKKSTSNNYSLAGNNNAVNGLANLGNTCFFNSVMQNLCQSQLLRVAVKHLMASDFQFCILPSEDKQEL
ncbi:ubiquitin carboxyl-terminal hydrolase 16 isoform X1, partial [Paramuricea clavata]